MLKHKSMLLTAVAFGLYGASAVADTTGTYGAETGAQTGAQTETRAQTGAQTGMEQQHGMEQEHQAQSKVKKASELMGSTVRDQQGEEIGQIEDFALDLEQGRLNYVVLDTGGFMEQRLVGISANELQASAEEEQAFVAQISQQEIEQAQALPEENWPSQPTVAGTGQQEADTEFAPFEGQTSEGQTSEGQAKVHKASELMGKTVRDQQGEDIGQIEDLALDLEQGELNYVVINAGGLMSERLVGISADDLSPAPDGDAFIASVSQQEIESAQALPDQNWPAEPTVGSSAGGELAPFEGQQQEQPQTQQY